MKKLSVFLLAVMLTAVQGLPSWAASYSSFSDVSGHWAGASLQRAVEDGVLNGSGGRLMPDSSLSGGQMATIVVRDCGIQLWTDPYPGTTAKDWYYRAAAEAYTAGLLPSDGSVSMADPVTREQVFVMLAKAYLGLKEDPAQPETPQVPDVPEGTDPEETVPEETEENVPEDPEPVLVPEGPEVPAETVPEDPEITSAPAVTLAETEAHAEDWVTEAQGTTGETGTPEDTGETEEAAEQPELTEDILSVYPDASDLSPGGRAAAVLLVDAGIVRGDGNGMLNPEKSITRAEFVTMLYRLKDMGKSPAVSYEDARLMKLQNARISVSASDAAAGGSVQASASFSGLPGDLVYDEIWLVDGNPVSGSYKPGKRAASQNTSSMSWRPSYTLHMKTSYRAGVELSWKAEGKTYRLYNEKPVNVANYPESHYVTLADGAKVTKIFDTVQSSYKGNRTSAYNPDYTDITKENFVNGKGYSSSTGYLIWANLATQKVNVFKGSKGNWQLIKCFRCASGASASPTPQGVTYVTYKQPGWFTSSYVCKPVVRFYPNSGYAFHSVLYTADGSRIKDGSMGYPVSHGCLRMMPAGIQWLYDNIPVKTTVVIY